MSEPAKKDRVDVRQVLSELSWYTLTNYGLRGIGLLRAVVLTTLVPLEVYGKVQLIAALAPYLLIPTFTGAMTAAVQFTARGREYLFDPVQRRRTRLSLLPVGLSFLIAAYYLHEGDGELALGIAAVGLLLPLTVQDTFISVLQGRRDYRTLMWVQWPAEILSVGATVAAAFIAPDNLFWLVVPATAIRGLAWVVGRRAAPPARGEATPEELGKEWSYIKQRSALGLLGFATSQLDRILVGTFFGFTDLAIYSFAKFASEQLNVLQRASLGVLFTRLSSRGEREANRLVPQFALYIFIAVAIGAVGVDLLVTGYVQWVVPDKFGASLPYVHWLLAAVCLAGPGSLLQVYFTAQKKTKWEWVTNTLVPLFYLAAMLVLMKLHGVEGLVYAYVARALVVSGFNFVLYRAYVQRSGSVLSE